MTAVLLTLALAPAAPTDAPGLQPGTELTFAGTIEEAVERPGVRFRRTQALELRVLVLEKQDAWTDVAVLGLLRGGCCQRQQAQHHQREQTAGSSSCGGRSGPRPAL